MLTWPRAVQCWCSTSCSDALGPRQRPGNTWEDRSERLQTTSLPPHLKPAAAARERDRSLWTIWNALRGRNEKLVASVLTDWLQKRCLITVKGMKCKLSHGHRSFWYLTIEWMIPNLVPVDFDLIFKSVKGRQKQHEWLSLSKDCLGWVMIQIHTLFQKDM